MAALAGEGSVSARALEFIILTGSRTGEAIGARWSEFDLIGRVWTVPGARMKAGLEHRVPLSDAALRALRSVEDLREPAAGNWVFRSTFRDWVSETTGYPREVAEAALAHTLKDKVEAAYRRGDLFTKRARLMDDWAVFCTRVAPAAGNVVALGEPTLSA